MLSGDSLLREHPRAPAPGTGGACPGLEPSGGSTLREHPRTPSPRAGGACPGLFSFKLPADHTWGNS
jgi:hypothetical protein